ncbi:MAG: hypothetical protein QOK40_746 [Miltoncostaeaceae bacterium]|nr:hypothetical protein [Miltoncostaeaceae bacterium]
MTQDDDRLRACRVLQVDPAACPAVIEAAFQVLREQACRDDSPAGGRRLVELNRAHRRLSERRPDARGTGR